ncbi:FG-GAP repeat domain-containing protein [Streptomyces sp. NRRL B-24484]|uniref:FG-GAP repeat domain-containing protein n=1 Tax=Streptomyces sp. NRRL B-24484 TaxID=1463833 RepID=UPI001331A7EC|nr:VCBS repeat-containing protein [Streptomyces sp. NRRL B-24484]
MHSSSTRRFGRSTAVSAAVGVVLVAVGSAQPASAQPAGKDRPSVGSPATSPASSCAGGTVLGDTSVTFRARLDSPSGRALGAEFRLTRADGTVVTAVGPGQLTVASGQEAVVQVPAASFEGAAAGRITDFVWQFRADADGRKSQWSPACRFSFDPTRQGAPVVPEPSGAVIGKPVTVTVAPPADGSVPAGYRYQLNVGAPVEVAAVAGRAVITLTPGTAVNSLTVTSVSPGGNPGGSTQLFFSAAAPPPNLTTADLTGDGVPDLVTVGGRNGLPSGIWLAPGTGDGHVGPAVNIGAAGPGYNTEATPADYDGTVALAGRFTAGSFQDVLFYHPAGIRAGHLGVRGGDGSGGALLAGGPNGDLTDWSGNHPSQVAEAGTVSGRATGFPDLLGIAPDGSGGTALTLYPAGWTTGTFDMPVALNVRTPDGGTDWNDWTIASTEVAAPGGGTGTALFLWKRSTGELDLWKDLAADPNTGALTYRSFPVATGWNTGADVELRAADIDSDGDPDLWTVGTGGQVTANLFGDPSATGTAGPTLVPDSLSAAG